MVHCDHDSCHGIIYLSDLQACRQQMHIYQQHQPLTFVHIKFRSTNMTVLQSTLDKFSFLHKKHRTYLYLTYKQPFKRDSTLRWSLCLTLDTALFRLSMWNGKAYYSDTFDGKHVHKCLQVRFSSKIICKTVI